MSLKYKCADQVPSAVFTKRLHELSDAAANGKKAIDREFCMRVPAEVDYDADLVLAGSARRITHLERSLSETVEALKRILHLGKSALPKNDEPETIESKMDEAEFKRLYLTEFKPSIDAELLEVTVALREYIDAIPKDIELPAMPGVDRDWVDHVISSREGK